MCSIGGGKSTTINGVKHVCYLCDHKSAIKEIESLQKENQELSRDMEIYRQIISLCQIQFLAHGFDGFHKELTDKLEKIGRG